MPVRTDVGLDLKYVINLVFFLILVFSGLTIWMAFISDPTTNQNNLFTLFMNLLSACVGGLVGLLGGKAASRTRG
jgi:hypothetical protein